jgi:PAS domain S-box-containing protein
LGALLCGVIVGVVTLSHIEWTTIHYLQVGIPILLALGLAAYGGWLVRSDLSPERIGQIALWSLVGAILLGSFAAWETYMHLLEGNPFVEILHEPLHGMTEGAAVGGVVGYYDAHRKDQYFEAERARQAISASMDGIAILDEDGKYEVVNQAHADVYGYDDSEAFVGETWHLCYTEEEAARVEKEVLPQLYEEGGWRGELTGQRRDGSTFPQDITLSVRPTGGLVCVVRDITERKQQEDRLGELHRITREFLAAETPDEITTELVSVADDILGYPLTVLWEYDADADRLVPLTAAEPARRFAAQAGLEDLPVLESGSAEMQVFRGQETVLVEDYQTLENRQVRDVPLGAVLFVPLGEHGLVGFGSTEAGVIDATDRFLAEILVSNATAAIDRVEREADLQRQTDQMEFFNSILRHDVLNGMTVIRGRAEFLVDELEGDQLQDAETIVDWSNDIVTIIQRVRTVLETLTGTGDPQLEPTDLSAALRSEVDRVRATYPEVAFETAIPDAVTVQANELLGEVLGNVITNAIDHNDTDGLCVSVIVEDPIETDDHVTVRIADNGRGVPDDVKEAIFRREETGHAKSTGSGFGLFFVDSMVTEYGGDVWVEDNDPQGAEFVIELPTP